VLLVGPFGAGSRSRATRDVREEFPVTGYLVRRFLWLFPVLFFVATITFMLMHRVPGGPWDQDRPFPPAVKANLDRKYNLDKSMPQQFGIYMSNIVRGDFGVSFSERGKPVRDIIARGIKPTSQLGVLAFLLATVVGISLGTLAAFNQNGPIDYLCVFFGTIGASFPSFIIATFLIIIFVVKLHWFNVLGWGNLKNSVLPVIALAFLPSSYIARLTRASVLEVIRQDYVRTARAKGLSEANVDFRHVVRNAMIPVITVLGPLFAALVSGSFIIEYIFSIPGIGRAFVQSVLNRDYGVIMGTTLFYALLIVLANLIVDVMYAVVDPRIRYS
jgi:oligopeptide transport system permease protein